MLTATKARQIKQAMIETESLINRETRLPIEQQNHLKMAAYVQHLYKLQSKIERANFKTK